VIVGKDSSEIPEISVLVASYRAGGIIHKCLRGLLAQDSGISFEIIVVESSGDRSAEELRKTYPELRVFQSETRMHPGDARNLAIRFARGSILAFMDADCSVPEGWIAEVARAHRRSANLVIGGIIDNGARDSLISWAYYFCEFNLWFPESEPRLIREIAGCCMSMKKAAFDRYGPFLSGTYCADTAFLREMKRDGHLFEFIPSICVYHDASGFGIRRFLGHIFEHRKAFARITARQFHFSFLKRALLAFCEVLLPVPVLLMIVLRVARSGYAWKWFIAAFPLIFAGVTARCCGEICGYLTNAE